MKKTLKVFTVLAVALSLLLTTTVTASAATVKISKSKATLYVGQTTTLRINNTYKKVTWTTSKKAVATVSSTGKVTAKKAGTAKITGKVNGKKYTCTVTVKNKVGSRQTPADPTKGVTITDYNGKYWFKLNNTWRHEDAVNKLKELGAWDDATYEYEHKEVGTDLLVMEFHVKALSGFDESALTDYAIFSTSNLYDAKATTQIEDFDSIWFINHKDVNNIKLFGGGEGTYYVACFAPDDVTTFTQYHYGKALEKFWIKYNI
jgi:hypothetical protein|nr:MAG TPA: intimin [Caudoviricetes sp.]